MEIKELMDQEKTKDFSEVDDIEFIKYLGALPLESDKLRLFQEIVNGKMPQQKLLAIVTSFYNKANPE